MTAPVVPADSTKSGASAWTGRMLTFYLATLTLSVFVGVVWVATVIQQCPSVEDAYLVMGCGDSQQSSPVNLISVPITAVLGVVIGLVVATVKRRRVSVPALMVWASVGLLCLALAATTAGGVHWGLPAAAEALAVVGAITGLVAGLGLCHPADPTETV